MRPLSETRLPVAQQAAPLSAPEESRPSQPVQGSVAVNALYLALGQAATTALAIGLTAALGRWLGAADYGTYYVLITMSTSVYLLLESGQSFWVVREIARAPERAGELLGTALAFRAAVVTASAIPVGLLTLALGYGVRTTWLFVLLFLAHLPLFVANGYGMAFRAAERMGRDAAVSVVNKVLVLSVALPALAVGAGIPGIALAQVLAGGAALFTARALYPGIDGQKLSVSRQVMRAMVLGGLPLLSMSVSGAAQPYLDAVILSKLAPATAVGYLEPPETSSARCWRRPSSWGRPPIRASPGRRTTRPRSLARCGVRCALCSGSGPSARQAHCSSRKRQWA